MRAQHVTRTGAAGWRDGRFVTRRSDSFRYNASVCGCEVGARPQEVDAAAWARGARFASAWSQSRRILRPPAHCQQQLQCDVLHTLRASL